MVQSKSGNEKIPYDPTEYQQKINDMVDRTRDLCETTFGAVFQHAWVGNNYIQLEYLFDLPHDRTESSSTTTSTSPEQSLKPMTVYVMLYYRGAKSFISSTDVQGIAAKDHCLQELKHSVDQLRAEESMNSPPRTVRIPAVKQADYDHSRIIKSLLEGAGAVNVHSVPLANNISYGLKFEGEYGDEPFRVCVYHKFSGAFNQKGKKRSAVWENPTENDERIRWLREALDAGIQSHKYLQRRQASSMNQNPPSPKGLTAKLAQTVILG